jgi:heat shock protein HspQ
MTNSRRDLVASTMHPRSQRSVDVKTVPMMRYGWFQDCCWPRSAPWTDQQLHRLIRPFASSIGHNHGLFRRDMIKARTAKFQIGQIVRHRIFSFRGVIFDIDPEFNNTEEWWLSIPEDVRPHKDQPFYHLLAENSESEYVAYVSEQNLLPDDSGEPIRHSQVAEIFVKDKSGGYRPRNPSLN